MKRLLILGSTGSIGTQALDVVARAPEAFELVGLSRRARRTRRWSRRRARTACAGSRWRTPTPPRAPPRRGPDGEVLAGPEGLVRLVAESGADLVLNAIVGSAGLGPTIVALTEGIDLALANKESLVVGGELVMALARGDRRAAHPGRLRALGAAPADRRRARRARSTGSSLTASGGPFRGRTRAELERRHRRAGARAPDVGDGRQDHDRLGDADEQGPRGDRGPPPVRHAVRPRSTSSCTRSRSSTRSSTLCDGATLAHLGHPDMRVPIAYALHHPERVDVPVPRARPRRGRRADLRAARRATRSRACGSRARRRWRAAPRRACSTPPTRSPCTRSSAGRLRLPRHPGGDRGDARARAAPRRVHALRLALRGRRRGARGRRRAGRRCTR